MWDPCASGGRHNRPSAGCFAKDMQVEEVWTGSQGRRHPTDSELRRAQTLAGPVTEELAGGTGTDTVAAGTT